MHRSFSYWYATFFLMNLFSCSLIHARDHLQVELFDFSKHDTSDCNDEKNPCFSVDELVKRALEFGLDSREQVQALFVARSNSKVKLGNILPQINVTSAMSAVIDMSASVDAILPLVGFLFPSRWMDWRSSRKLFHAEEQSLATLFADRAQAIQLFYFDVQNQIWSIRILEFYIEQLEKIIAFLDDKNVHGIKRATEDDLAVLENIRAELIYMWAFVDALSSVLPHIATAIGLDPHVDWAQLKLEPHSVAMMGKLEHRHYVDIFPVAVEKSTELKNVDLLIKAAKYTKRGTYFDFFDAESGNNLGYGHGHRIKIARANISILDIQKQRTEMQISNAIQDALNNYNDAVNAFPAIEKALGTLEALRSSLEQHLNDDKTPLDINKLVRYFTYANGQTLRYVQNYFIFHEAEASIDRFTWSGKIYDTVIYYKDFKLPEFLNAAKREHSLRRAFKNKMASIKEVFHR